MITIDGTEFVLADFEKSVTAEKKGIENKIQGDDVQDFEFLRSMLETVQKHYGKPIYVNSGFRNPELNKAVGGSKTSQHCSPGASAATDITTGTKEGNKALFELIQKLQKSGIIQFDQLINEYDYKWIHWGVLRLGVNRCKAFAIK